MSEEQVLSTVKETKASEEDGLKGAGSKAEWSTVIEPKSGLLELNLKDLWRYRDLLLMFVKRDIVTVYKQTVLGPAWFFLQPILTTAMYIIVFGNIANISTEGIPQVLFYLSGIVLWNYFADTFNATSKTFKENQNIFGKVYFPRLIMPLSKVSSGFIKFGIQFLLFAGFYIYFLFQDAPVYLTEGIFLLPVLVLLMAGLGLGAGIIFTSMTTKYRDLTFLLTFGVQLLMYATPVIYPLSTVPEKYRMFILANPITPIVEGFRYALLGTETFRPEWLIYSAIFTVLLLFVGIIIFNKTEKKFMDTV